MLISIYLRRLLFLRVPLRKSLLWNLEHSSLVRNDCVMNKVNYKRDWTMFQNLVTRSHGNRMLVIVGLFHVKNMAKFLNLYKEACQKYSTEISESAEFNPSHSVEEIIAQQEKRQEVEEKILDYANFNKDKIYCDEKNL